MKDMTSTIRCLVLLGASAALCACSSADRARTDEAKPRDLPAQKAPPAPAAPETKSAPSNALTAVAPVLAPSIADAPPAEQNNAQAVVSAEQDFAHEEPESEGTVNYDRPLDPAEVKIDRFVLSTDVQGREPAGESDRFSTDTKKIFAFVQLANADSEPYAFRVHWEAVESAPTPYGVKLEVPTAARFRTWSWTRIERTPGRYKAVLRTLEGTEIASREFVIEAASE
jgi:hypothetical protein